MSRKIKVTIEVEVEKLPYDFCDENGIDRQEVKDFDLGLVDSDLVQQTIHDLFYNYYISDFFELQECPNNWPWRMTGVSK